MIILRFISITVLSTFWNFIFCQSTPNQIEINSYLQYNNYTSFTYPTSSVTNTTVTLKGISWGIQPTFKFPFIKNNFFAKLGLGYYKYSFNDIEQYTRLFGTYNNREIDFPGGSSTFGYTTKKYWYNTLSASIGIERLFHSKKNLTITSGFNLFNYYTFSQRYVISSNIRYKTSDSRYFGFAANIYAGVQKKFRKISIGPTFTLPIYSLWKQDDVFPQEYNNMTRDKWLGGLGVGVTFNYSLKKL